MPIHSVRCMPCRAALVAVAVALAVALGRGAIAPDAPAPADKPIVGIWQGTLKIGAIGLRLVFKIAADDAGGYRATFDSLDQGSKGIAVDSVSWDGTTVKLDLKTIKGTFEGKLGDDGREIKGAWTQSGRTFPLDLKRVDKGPTLNRPQEPKKPYPYAEEQVVYENAAASVKLAGTLTLPPADKPCPAVLLITGSGSQDRDESLLGHKPFLVLADYLTRRGIAVLRVDDRGVGGSTGSPTSTSDELAGDVLCGVDYLKSRKEIDPRRIGLIGHSEGGLIAPIVASRSRDVAFIVLLAGTGVTGEEIIYHQQDLIAKAGGANALTSALAVAANRRLFKIVKEEPDPAKCEEKLRAALAPASALASVASPAAKKDLDANLDTQMAALVSPWFRFFLVHDPQPVLRKVACPVLVLNGEKDLQVDPRQNLPPIEAALKDGGNPDYTIKQLPDLNHLFQHCQSGSPSEYGEIEETFSPQALEIIGDWILERMK